MSRYQHVHTYLAWWKAYAGWFRRPETKGRAVMVELEWPGSLMTEAEFRLMMQTALDRRICHKGGLPVVTKSWRKLDPDYQDHMMADCRAIRDHAHRGVRTYYLHTPEMRTRYAHILAHRDD